MEEVKPKLSHKGAKFKRTFGRTLFFLSLRPRRVQEIITYNKDTPFMARDHLETLNTMAFDITCAEVKNQHQIQDLSEKIFQVNFWNWTRKLENHWSWFESWQPINMMLKKWSSAGKRLSLMKY